MFKRGISRLLFLPIAYRMNKAYLVFFNIVFLISQVIGLHKNGYGRILAECMFNAKILYCQWATLAKEDDIFVIKTTIPLPSLINWSEEDHITFIRERIVGKSNEEIARVNRLARSSEIKSLVGYFTINHSQALHKWYFTSQSN